MTSTSWLRSWRKPLAIGVSVLLAVLAAVGITFSANPLPSDSAMVAHFRAHRSEFEKLVERFRGYKKPSDAQSDWNDLPDIVALRESLGVRVVVNIGSIWLNNPYSAQTSQRLVDIAKSDGRAFFALQRQFGSVAVRLNAREHGPRLALVGTSAARIWKDFVFFPYPPKVEEGRLWEPPDTDGKLKLSKRVFSDLSGYPPEWQKGECVYRLIEAQWFIRMCWGAS